MSSKSDNVFQSLLYIGRKRQHSTSNDMKENLLGQPVEEHEHEEVASIATKFSTSKVHETTRLISELEEGDERDPNVVAADALPSAEVLVGHEEIVQPVTDFDSTFQVEPIL